MPIKVVVADDQALFRKALIAILQSYPQIEVLGEAADANQVVEILKKGKPDVLLLDLNLPGMSGYDIFDWLKIMHPLVKVIVISTYDDDKYVMAAIESGALGFLSKNAHINEVYNAIVKVFTNGFYFNDLATNALLNSDPKKTRRDTPLNRASPSFSEKEIAIIKLIAQNLSLKEISEMLSENTRDIGYHLSEIMKKTGVPDIKSLIHYAATHNIIP